MLEIVPYTEPKQIAEYCKKIGKIPDDSFYLYVAKNKDKQLGACLFEVGSDSVQAILYDCVDESDYWLFDGLLRAGFHYAFEQGIRTGCIPEQFRMSQKNLFARLNYPATPEFDITNFFQKYKNCKNGDH